MTIAIAPAIAPRPNSTVETTDQTSWPTPLAMADIDSATPDKLATSIRPV